MTFEINGSLAPGIHDCTFDEFYETFVGGFPTSQRRKLILDALLVFSSSIFSVGMPHEFWIDGSYATTKVNPNDVDIVLFLQYEHMAALAPKWWTFRQQYDGVLDMYCAYAVSHEIQQRLSQDDYEKVFNHRNYWLNQFGKDREGNPKGIIRIECSSMLERLKGGE